MAQRPSPQMLEFLAWIARRPRSYEQTMDAWRTSCPRLSIWEDALMDGLVELESTSEQAAVTLSPKGEDVLRAGRCSEVQTK